MKRASTYILLHIIILLFSCAEVLSKYASMQKFLSLPFILLYGGVLLILFVYALLWQQILKKIPLITAYVNKAVAIIWGLIFGIILFGEKLTIGKIAGICIVIAGVLLVVMEDNKSC